MSQYFLSDAVYEEQNQFNDAARSRGWRSSSTNYISEVGVSKVPRSDSSGKFKSDIKRTRPSSASVAVRSSPTKQPVNQRAGSSNRHKKRPLSASLDSLHKEKEKILSDLTFQHDLMVKRVKSLWKELKFPRADIEFYMSSLCQSPPQSAMQCKELAKYIQCMQLHR